MPMFEQGQTVAEGRTLMRFGGGKKTACMLLEGKLSVFMLPGCTSSEGRSGAPVCPTARKRLGQPIKNFPPLDGTFTNGSEGALMDKYRRPPDMNG